MDILFFLQAPLTVGGQAAQTAATVVDPPAVVEMTVLDQLIQGWYIYIPMLIISVIAVYIFIERSLAVKRADKDETNFMAKIREYIHQGKLDSAKNLCSTSETPLARMIEKGIGRIGRSVEEINKAVENTGRIELHKMEKNINIIATIATIAPMLGFLGTVFGVITIFHDIGQQGSLQIGTVANGLYIKMFSSAAGLIIGMMAYIFYNTLVTRVGKVVNKMEVHAVEFIDILEQPTN
ncbi:MAG: MotA/TolQ/ExbB proton channel family protein [Crocinitomicaceae bacterium]|nr:MotA/TolQ/ExbB proton channel family protein [Crocinitomicaceae bacterium]